MKNIETFHTKEAPTAIGPYSQAVRAGDFLYISGQIPLIPETMTLIDGDIKVQAQQIFENIKQIALAANCNFNQCVKIGIFLTDMNDFAQVNEVMVSYFDEPFPARACVEVSGLPKDAKIEIESIFFVG